MEVDDDVDAWRTGCATELTLVDDCRAGNGGGRFAFGEGTMTKSPVATGVISALESPLDGGKPILRKSFAGIGGGARFRGS